MKTVILNWSGGENDPFTFVNKKIKDYLIRSGKDPVVLEIPTPDFISKLTEIESGIDFVFTWQGLGSDITIKVGDIVENLWSYLQIPLVCVHGDHPSHTPALHVTENAYCTHLYIDRDFAFYSNKYFRTTKGAEIIELPLMHNDTPLQLFNGKYFVFAKNITHPSVMENNWKNHFDSETFRLFCSATEELKKTLSLQKGYLDCHSALDEIILREEYFHPLRGKDRFLEFNYLHSQIDFFMRNYKSTVMIERLGDFPIRIYGKGWDAVKHKSPNHEYFDGLNLADSQGLFYSEYGILDISPFRGLHDRSLRALANNSPFLSSGYLNDIFQEAHAFDTLFFHFADNDLLKKCESVVSDPIRHRSLAIDFSKKYRSEFPFKEFVRNLTYTARIR